MTLAMEMLRAAIRLFLAMLPAVLLSVPAFLGRALGSLFGQRGQGAAVRAGARIQTLWARSTLALLGIEVSVEQAPPVGRWVIVSNHLSYLDILVLASLFEGRFVAKSEIASWPLLGFFARAPGTIFIERDRRRAVVGACEEVSRSLEAGVSAIVFPEGSSSRGLDVGPFHSSLLESAVVGDIPCLPVAISYETPGARWAPAWTVCWWGGMPLWPHLLRLLGLRTIRAHLDCGEALRGEDRKALAQECRRRVCAMFRPLAQAPASPWGEAQVLGPSTR